MSNHVPPDPPTSHRLVAKMCQEATDAAFTMAPHDLSDLVHCIAALGVDMHRLIPNEGESDLSPVLQRLIRRLDRLHQQIVVCFHQGGLAVRPDTACALLLHLVARIADSENVDIKLLADLAAAKLQPGGGQDGHEIVDVARRLRLATTRRRKMHRRGPAE